MSDDSSSGLGKVMFGLGLAIFLITSLNPLVRHGNNVTFDWLSLIDAVRTLQVLAPVLFAFVVAYFAWRRERWAYWTVVGVSGLVGAANLVFVVTGDLGTVGGQESLRWMAGYLAACATMLMSSVRRYVTY